MNQKKHEGSFFTNKGRQFFPVLVMLVFFINPSQGRIAENLFLQKLTTFNGLSSNYIQCVFRDSRGYVWIGTPNGLNRYDGMNIKVYHHNPDNPKSLPCESIFHIAEDKNGNLWINSGSGLISFDPFAGEFNYFRHDENDPKSIGSDFLVPFVDSGNNLWAATQRGLQLFDRKLSAFKTFSLSPADSVLKNPSLGYAWAVAEDNSRNIWCCGVKGLYKFDTLKQELKLFAFQNKSFGQISDIFIDHEGNFWVVFWKTGINLFYPETGIFEPVLPMKNPRFNIYGKMGEWKDPFGEYWLTICTERGLLLYNSKSFEMEVIQNESLNQYSLIYDDVYYTYTDAQNIVWIGTKKGLNILDNADQAFHTINVSQGKFSDNQRVKGSIETIYEDNNLKMISFLSTKGLGIYDPHWNLVQFYPNIPPADTSYEARDIFGIYKDFAGLYWITTDKSLVRFDIKTNIFKTFMPPDGGATHAKTPGLMREIIPYDSSTFYIRTKARGIYKFDFIKQQFVQHLFHKENDPFSLPNNYIRGVLKDDKNRLIIMSLNAGIFIYTPATNTYEIFYQSSDVSTNQAIKTIYFDPSLSGNTLWLNTAEGLLKFDLRTKKFELFNSRNGLANDYLISNEVDDNGNVWVAHNAGISKFDIASQTFTNYSENNGLIFQKLNHNMKKMKDGNIYIGADEKLIYFNPSQLSANKNVPQVHIYSVQVLNEPYQVDFDSITSKKSVKLNYAQDLITVDFSVLNFSHPNKNSFFFRLDNDPDWHQLKEGSVNLARLSPGDYVLHVTGSNDSGMMNPAGDALYITILPPYYQTWWFRLLILVAAVLIIVEIRRRGIKRIKREEQLKTEFNKQLAQAETKALRSQMNPHFIFNCLNSINSFVIDHKHEIASDYLIMFSKLIRLILDNSRSEKITIEKELETLKLYVLLESARFDNKFNCIYSIAEDVNTGLIMIPPMLLQPYVENAIWHGLMQKEGEGTITIEIKLENDEFLNITISDDGIGRVRASEIKSKSVTHQSHGLKVTSQRIELMNTLNSTGAQVQIIDLKNELGQVTGTKIELIIPF